MQHVDALPSVLAGGTHPAVAALAATLPSHPAYPRRDDVQNGLICLTNCLQLQKDGALVARDLQIDECRGVVLDAQVCFYTIS
jgi:hypothetical protein